MRFVNEQSTLYELFEWTNWRIEAAGFENLGLLRNVGHSIATRLQDRVYVTKGDHDRLNSIAFFTFEPHVRAKGGHWWFKQENILFFSSAGRPEIL
jgi:hypothetical protein